MTKDEAFKLAMDLLLEATDLTGPTTTQIRLLDDIAKAIFEAHLAGYRAGYLDSENGATPIVGIPRG